MGSMFSRLLMNNSNYNNNNNNNNNIVQTQSTESIFGSYFKKSKNTREIVQGIIDNNNEDVALPMLPSFVIHEIFSYLPPEDMPILVCKSWFKYFSNPKIWRQLAKKYCHGKYIFMKHLNHVTFKKEFIKIYFDIKPARKVMNLVHTLISMGYPVTLSIKTTDYFSDYAITIKSSDGRIISGNSISKISMFGVESPTQMSDLEFAKRFVEAYDLVKSEPNESDILFQKMFSQIMASLSRWDIFVNSSNPSLCTICCCPGRCLSVPIVLPKSLIESVSVF